MPKGYHHSEETKRKISETKKGTHHSEEAKKKIGEASKGRFKGITLTDEHKKKISDSHKGKRLSEEQKRRIGEGEKGRTSPMKGKHHSEETKQKIEEKRKGHPVTEITRQKIGEGRKGLHQSGKTRKKISKALKGPNNPMYGKHLTDEQKQQISERNKGKTNPKKNDGKEKVFPLKGIKRSKADKEKIRKSNIGKHTLSGEHKEVLAKMSHYGYYIQVNGQPFKSIAEVARTYNLDYQKLRLALKEYRDLAGNPDYEERKDLEGYKDLSEFGLEYDYETSTVFKRRWGEYLEKELEERPYRQEEIIFIALKYKEKN